MIHRSSPQARRPGATIVESAIVLGTCLLFVMAVFEYGRFLMIRQLLTNAAREAARQAVVSPDSVGNGLLESTVIDSLADQPVQDVRVDAYRLDPQTGAHLGPWSDTPFGCPLAVEITGSYHPLLPTLGLLPNPVPVRMVCVMSREAN